MDWRQRLKEGPWGIFLVQVAIGLAAATTPALQNGGYKALLVLGIVQSLLLPLVWTFRRWGIGDASPLLRGRAVVYLGLSAVAPAVIFGGAVLFTKRCEVADGLAMFLLGYLPGAALCFSLIELLRRLGPKIAAISFAAVWALLLIQGVHWFMSEPVYQVAHPLVGMLLGPPNEAPEVLTWRVLYFSLEVMSWAAAIMALSLVLEHGKEIKRWHLMVGAMGLVGLVTLIPQDAELGYRIDSEHLLGGKLRHVEHSDGIKHVMSPVLPSDARPWILLDAAFEQRRQAELFGLNEEQLPPTTIYWFRNKKEKRELTGAGRTKFAKVHLGELYLSVDSFPVRTLAHELSHVTSGAFSDTFLQVPGRLGGVWYNPALVEGFAVAVAWSDKTLSAHEQARIALDKGRVPPLDELFSPLGFATNNLSVAYRVSGSFFKFCLDKYGPDPVKAWYGSEDFEGSFGVSLEEAERLWLAYLRSDELTAKFANDVEGVDKVQSRPSIAQESCGKPQSEKDLKVAMSAEADEEVERILTERVVRDGETPAIWYARMKYRAVRSNYDCELPDPNEVELPKRLGRRYAYLQALATWGRGEQTQAREMMNGLEMATKRSDDVILSRLLLNDGFDSRLLFIDSPRESILVLFEQWEKTKHPVFGYKLARRLARGQRWESLAAVLAQLTWDGVAFPDEEMGTVVLATEELRGRCAFARRQWSDARKAWQSYADMAPSQGRRSFGETWLARTRFFEANQSRLKSDLPRL